MNATFNRVDARFHKQGKSKLCADSGISAYSKMAAFGFFKPADSLFPSALRGNCRVVSQINRVDARFHKQGVLDMRDIYQEVTDRIITALESGTAPWLRPWRDGKSGSTMEPFNAQSGRSYNGINLLILGTTRFASLGWITFKQAIDCGGNVKKGEKGTQIIFWKFEAREDETTGKTKTVPFARAYTVFNVEQCENLDQAKLKLPEPPQEGAGDMNALAAKIGATVQHGGNKAFFTTRGDFIRMPGAETFKSSEHYQATLAHELTHWTGHEKRLNREFGKRFGDAAYAFEELVAEIGSAFLCARHGIALDGLQHANYLASWLKILQSDKRAIFTASSKAKEAAAYLLQHKGEGESEGEALPIAA